MPSAIKTKKIKIEDVVAFQGGKVITLHQKGENDVH